MAIALVQSQTTGLGDTGGDSVVLTFTSNVTAGNLVLVAVAQRDETISVSLSGLGATWTEIANVDNVQNQGGISTWRCSDANGSSAAVTVTVTGNLNPISVNGAELSGVDVSTTDGVEAVASTTGPGTDDDDMLYPVTTVTANAWAVAMGWHRGQTLTDPPAAGETTISLNNLNGTAGKQTHCSTWYEGPVASPASTQLGAAADLSANGDWCMTVVSVKPSVAGGVTYAKTGGARADRLADSDRAMEQYTEGQARFDLLSGGARAGEFFTEGSARHDWLAGGEGIREYGLRVSGGARADWYAQAVREAVWNREAGALHAWLGQAIRSAVWTRPGGARTDWGAGGAVSFTDFTPQVTYEKTGGGLTVFGAAGSVEFTDFRDVWVPAPVLRADPEITVTLHPPGGAPIRLEPVLDTLRYSTAAVGGFGACSFTLPGLWTPERLPDLSMLRLHHGDSLLWEGRLEDRRISISPDAATTGVVAYGLHRRLADKTMRQVWLRRAVAWQPVFPATSASRYTVEVGRFDQDDFSRFGVRFAGIVGVVATPSDGTPTTAVFNIEGLNYSRLLLTATLGPGANGQGLVQVAYTSGSTLDDWFAASGARTYELNRESLDFVSVGYRVSASTTLAASHWAEYEHVRLFGAITGDNDEGFYGGTLLRDLIRLVPDLHAGLIDDGREFLVENFERLVRDSVLSGVEEVANYYARDWAVWEGGRFDWTTRQLDRPDWALTIPELTSLELDTSLDTLARTRYVLFPDATADQQVPAEKSADSTSRRNPFVRVAAAKDAIHSVGFGMTPNSAQQLATKLTQTESQYPAAAGTVRLAADRLIRRADGTLAPAYAIRAGQNVLVADLPTDEPFLAGQDGRTLFHVIATEVDLGERTVTLEIEGQTRRSDVLLARLAAVTRTVTGS